MNRLRCGGSGGAASVWVVVAVLAAGILAVIGIAAVFVAPLLAPGGESANEASAVGWLRAINTGEAAYSAKCGEGGYAVSLGDLAKPPRTGGGPFVPGDIGRNGATMDGYRFTLVRSRAGGVTEVGAAAATCNGATATPASGYFATAEPTAPGTSGKRYFATDASGIVYRSDRPIANPIRPSAAVVAIQ
jgi:hypothetical protein